MPHAIAQLVLGEWSMAQVAPEALAKGIRLESGLPQDVNVFVDDGLIVRVLTNLLANAVKHTPSGGTVSVESARDRMLESSIVIRVRDTGPGVNADDAPHIFDRFYQGAGRSRGGTGLCLAFCKLAVELHGGGIAVVKPRETRAIVPVTPPPADRAPAGGLRPGSGGAPRLPIRCAA